MDNQNAPQDFVALWEQMGANTGSFLGKLIGLSAQYTLNAYEQTVVNPLQQLQDSLNPPPSDTGVPPDIRTRTWQEMCSKFGESWGKSIGLAMDVFINSLKTSAESCPGFNQETRHHYDRSATQTNQDEQPQC